MKTLDVRFVKIITHHKIAGNVLVANEPKYLIQRRFLRFWWKYYKYPTSHGYGTYYETYSSKSKAELFNEVIDKVYKTTLPHVSYRIHPEIIKITH